MFYTFVAVSLAPLRFYLDFPAPPAVIQLQGRADIEGTEIVYNHLAFQSGRLLYGEHTLVVASVSDQQFCFDYALYSTDEADPPEIHESDTVPQIPSATIGTRTTDTVTGTVTGRPARDSAPARFDARAVAGAVAAVAAAVIAIAAWWYIRRARRRARAAAEGDRPAVFMAQPDPSLAAPAEKEHRNCRRDTAKPPRDDITPFVSQPERAEPAGGKPRGMPSEISGESSETQVDLLLGQRDATADVRAELARVRAENERARREIEMLRLAAEPPPYPLSESSGGTIAR